MKRFFIALIPVFLISFLSLKGFAQDMNGPPPYGDFKATKFPDDNFSDRSGISPRFAWLREDRVMKSGLLAPAANDRLAARTFLKQKNTGLIRLLPREIYGVPTYHPKQRVGIRGGGAYYSFAYLTHIYGYGSDIELDHNRLSVGFAGADFGMMTNLGDKPLDEITLSDLRTSYLAKYNPPRAEPKAREEYRRFSSPAGVMVDGVLYRKTLPVQENATYLLRSIVYDRSDVLVAFRILRKDTDGSVIIAWKLLKRYSTKKLF